MCTPSLPPAKSLCPVTLMHRNFFHFQIFLPKQDIKIIRIIHIEYLPFRKLKTKNAKRVFIIYRSTIDTKMCFLLLQSLSIDRQIVLIMINFPNQNIQIENSLSNQQKIHSMIYHFSIVEFYFFVTKYSYCSHFQLNYTMQIN